MYRIRTRQHLACAPVIVGQAAQPPWEGHSELKPFPCIESPWEARFVGERKIQIPSPTTSPLGLKTPCPVGAYRSAVQSSSTSHTVVPNPGLSFQVVSQARGGGPRSCGFLPLRFEAVSSPHLLLSPVDPSFQKLASWSQAGCHPLATTLWPCNLWLHDRTYSSRSGTLPGLNAGLIQWHSI